jgi:ribulose-phosphate 3-epimerase
MSPVKLAPSILSADFSKLGEQVIEVETAGADMLHIDVMDGHFVPNISIGPLILDSLRGKTSLPFDTHLMIENPEKYIKRFVSAGSDIITVHAEASPHLHRLIHYINDCGAKAGVALNPSTPLTFVENVLVDLDLLLIMTVNPGFGGQTFIKTMLPKIEEARELIDQSGLEIELEVDGGIKPENARDVAKAGANILVSGSGIFNFKHPIPDSIKAFRSNLYGL